MTAKAYNTKGMTIMLTDPGATPTPKVPTAISKAKPAVVSIASTAGMANGDIAYCSNTGFPELDGRYFAVGALAAGTFTLVGSDTTGSLGALATTPNIDIYGANDMTDLGCLMKELTVNADAPQAIAAGTYCDPSLTITSAVIPPTTMEWVGNIDVGNPAYGEMYAAYEDGVQRGLVIGLPHGQGMITAPVVVSLWAPDLPIDGAMAFNLTMTLGSRPKHTW